MTSLGLADFGIFLLLSGLKVTTSRIGRFEQEEVFASAAFDVLELPGGTLQAVVGAEYRKETYSDQYDSLSEAGQVGGSAGNSAGGGRDVKGAFFEGFLTNTLNPKVSIFYLAAFPQFMPTDGSAFSAYSLVTAHSIVNVVWFSVMVFTLAKVKSATSHPKFKVWLNSMTGVAFIGFGSKLALMKND